MMTRPQRTGVSRFSRSVASCLGVCVLATIFLTSSGCQLAYFLSPEKKKDVKAEYGKIGSKEVAIVVWADHATLDVDPQARRRVCKIVTYYMRKCLSSADFVSPRKITDLQSSFELDWESLTNAELCKELSCDLILRLDLLHYTTRASDTRALRKARVGATLNMYECGSGAGDLAVYETEVTVDYPPGSRHGVADLEDADLLREAIELFGQMVARKFYDHEESLRGPSGG